MERKLELFPNKSSFDYISLKGLATRYLDEGKERIELAGFQRGAVWKGWQVEALWDSLLRWFPIGSLLMARSTEFSVGIQNPIFSSSGKSNNIVENGYGDNIFILIDGQQRSNAIALGFLTAEHPKFREAGARLWIDLAAPMTTKQFKTVFYLCTQDNPFGENITAQQKRDALESIQQDDRDDSEIDLKDSYPYKAELPIPFAEFVKVIEKSRNLEEIKEELFSGNNLHVSPIVQGWLKEKILEEPTWVVGSFIIDSIREVVTEEKYKIPIILFEKKNDQVESKELGILFERINVNGTTPPQAELFYSALKLMNPMIGNYVAEVNKKQNLKGILKPTDIVLTAIRLVKSDVTEIRLKDFEKITSDGKEQLLDLLKIHNGEDSVFSKLFQFTYDTLHYRGGKDIGLPRQLILRLKPRVWQTIMQWLYFKFPDGDAKITSVDRLNFIQFAVLDALDYLIFTIWWRGYSRYVLDQRISRVLTESIKGQVQFSARSVFKQIKSLLVNDHLDNNSTFHIFTPEEYYNWLKPTRNNEINWGYGYGGNVILMYSQREYLAKWESLNDIDKDHIIPYAWMVFSGPVGTSRFWLAKNLEVVARSTIRDNPGNFRFWPATLNRQYQDRQPTDKYLSTEKRKQLDDNHKKRELYTVNDILKASFVSDEILAMITELELKKAKKGDRRVWTEDQVQLMQKIVYGRSRLMYENLYNALLFNKIEE